MGVVMGPNLRDCVLIVVRHNLWTWPLAIDSLAVITCIDSCRRSKSHKMLKNINHLPQSHSIYSAHTYIVLLNYTHKNIKEVLWQLRAFSCNNLACHVTDRSDHVSEHGRDRSLEQGWIWLCLSVSVESWGKNESYFFLFGWLLVFVSTSVLLCFCKMPSCTHRVLSVCLSTEVP